LQKQYDALIATLIVGVFWGLWHLPLFFWADHPLSIYPLSSFIGFVAGAFIYTWLYNSTKGSILLVALFHVAENIFGEVVPGVSPIANTLLICVVAIVLVSVFGRANLSRRERVCTG
jgi:membrane protease YdiL (CAAX protease family)